MREWGIDRFMVGVVLELFLSIFFVCSNWGKLFDNILCVVINLVDDDEEEEEKEEEGYIDEF